MKLRRQARAWSLVACGAFGSYLVHAAIVGRAALWIAGSLRDLDSAVVRLLLGLLVIDVTKLVALLPAGWLLAPRVALGPATAATGLVLLTYALETAVLAVVQQLSWTSAPVVIAARAACAALLVWMVARLMQRRRGRLAGSDGAT